MEGKRTAYAWYRAIFENSPHGIIFFDTSDFTIRETNTTFSDLLHYKPEELRGRVFTSLFLDEEEKKQFISGIGRGQIITRYSTRFETKDGSGCRLDLFWKAVDDTTTGCTATTSDIRNVSISAVDNELVQNGRLGENLPTSLLFVRDGIIQYANPAFSDFSEYLPEEIPGLDLHSLIDNADQQNCKELVHPGLEETHKAQRCEFRFLTKNGNRRTALLYTRPVTFKNEPAVLINLVDISEKHLLEERIQLDNERRRGIIVTVAHELRTPLQPILGYLNLLIQDPGEFGITTDTKKILERCLSSVDRERQIINQMLELSVLDSGKLHLNLSKFPVSPLINSVLDSGGYGTKAEIILDIPENIVITADMDRLYSVLDSLLSNAVNFSQPPRRIAIFYRPDPRDTFHQISVRDNGMGISENALSSIFEPFQLADAAKLSRRFDRIGLSLSMAKKIMQMHGGDITVESRVRNGSTFTLHLPKSVQKNA
jgi:PAS domain S-box-containing protein